uniref:Leucine Rich Repeat family protein n=1 Tax=Oryza sativa subsp. japonica TaxID=39947 RepID=Q2R2J1_ORYSJ|nr:Leucine Rich Repeat family protein [Oryza sativa Japonica Group]
MLVSTFEHALRHLKSLWFLDLSDNHLIGHVPLEISTLTKLAWLDLSYNDLDGLITEELFDGLKSLKNIGLSDNRLKIVVGSDWIPPFRLKVANLASCHIGPLFPSWFKWPMGISHINISRANSLSGVIPWQLSNLEAMTKRKSMLRKLPNNYSRGVDRYLSRFKHMVGELSVTTKRQDLKYQGFALLGIVTIDLSSNYLTGRIPSGGQLDTLYNNNPSMYDGNAGLCGDILKKKCPGNDASNDYGSYKDHYELLYLCFGLVIGFVLGLWVVFSTLLFKKSWRIAYFRLFDKIMY